VAAVFDRCDEFVKGVGAGFRRGGRNLYTGDSIMINPVLNVVSGLISDDCGFFGRRQRLLHPPPHRYATFVAKTVRVVNYLGIRPQRESGKDDLASPLLAPE
jgi:hypothetical protein